LFSAAGSIESPHGHLKRAIDDALHLRGRADNLAIYGIPIMAIRFPAVNNI
jgi:hypothetical protein